jgi:hypothetical protein
MHPAVCITICPKAYRHHHHHHHHQITKLSHSINAIVWQQLYVCGPDTCLALTKSTQLDQGSRTHHWRK